MFRASFSRNDRTVQKIVDPNSAAANLVFVAWTDPAPCGADRSPALPLFAGKVERAVIGHDDMRVKADHQVAGCYVPARFLEAIHFTYQFAGIKHHSVSDHAQFVSMKDSGGDKVENMLLPVYDQRVAGIVSALKPDDEIRLFSKQIDNLALTFIAPLSAHYDYIRHVFIFLSSHIVRPITRSKRKDTVHRFPPKRSRDDWPVGI